MSYTSDTWVSSSISKFIITFLIYDKYVLLITLTNIMYNTINHQNDIHICYFNIKPTENIWGKVGHMDKNYGPNFCFYSKELIGGYGFHCSVLNLSVT